MISEKFLDTGILLKYSKMMSHYYIRFVPNFNSDDSIFLCIKMGELQLVYYVGMLKHIYLVFFCVSVLPL